MQRKEYTSLVHLEKTYKIFLENKHLRALMLVLLLFLLAADKDRTQPATTSLEVAQHTIVQHPTSIDAQEVITMPRVDIDTVDQLKSALFHGFAVNLRRQATEYKALVEFIDKARESGLYATFDATTDQPQISLLANQITLTTDHVVGVQDIDCLPALPLNQQPTGIKRFAKKGSLYIVQHGAVQDLQSNEIWPISTIIPTHPSTFDSGLYAQLAPDNRIMTQPDTTHGARIANEIMRSIHESETTVFCAGRGLTRSELWFIQFLAKLGSTTLVVNRSLGVTPPDVELLTAQIDAVRQDPQAPIIVLSNSTGNEGKQRHILGQGNGNISWVMATDKPKLLTPYSNYPFTVDSIAQPFIATPGTILAEIAAGRYILFSGTSPAAGLVSAAVAHHFETATNADLASLRGKTSAEITQLVTTAAVGTSPTLTYTVVEGGQILTVTAPIPLEDTLAISNVMPLLRSFGIPISDTIVTFADRQPSHISLPLWGVNLESSTVGPLPTLMLNQSLIQLLKSDLQAYFTYQTNRGNFTVNIAGTFGSRISGFSLMTDAFGQYPAANTLVSLRYQDGYISTVRSNYLPKEAIYTVPFTVYLPVAVK